MKNLIGKGSSRNLYTHSDLNAFVEIEFSDRVSVFDYGSLPDEVPGKKDSLKDCAIMFFEALEASSLKTAYAPAESKSKNAMILKAAKHPHYPIPGAELEFLPLEVIFRWGVTPGSALLKRKPELKPYQRFDEVLIEFTTKLEAQDRHLDEAEATKLAGGKERFDKLKVYAQKAALCLKERLEKAQLCLWDGKIECAVDPATDEIVMLDPLTPDEIRVTLPGLEKIPLSKEILRQWMARTPWSREVAIAKKSANNETWKENVSAPPRIGAWRLHKFGGLYKSFTQSLKVNNSQPLMDWVREDDLAPKVFVLGNGGRETAVRWRLENEGVQVVKEADKADVVWISKDCDLAYGIEDKYRKSGAWTFGPSKEASQIEWSKEYGREIAQKAGINIPKYTNDISALKSFSKAPVVKLDGLAGGKGVVVPETFEEAEKAINDLSKKGTLLLEERCEGIEASAFFAIQSGSAGVEVSFLGSAQDFKRRFNGNEGPNTGGMGAYCPHPEVTKEDEKLFQTWAQSTADQLLIEGRPYNGILYLGLMKDRDKGWLLIEYNARLGDPETQALVCSWPKDKAILRPFLSLSLTTSQKIQTTKQALCLALVTPDYPKKSAEIAIDDWQPESENILNYFLSSSRSGRVAYLVGQDESSLLKAGDHVFQALVKSPLKEKLEWRSDILK